MRQLLTAHFDGSESSSLPVHKGNRNVLKSRMAATTRSIVAT